MEEEAIITAVKPGSKRTIDDSLDLEFLNVSFRILRCFKYQDKVVRVTLKSPSWLANLQISAPLGGLPDGKRRIFRDPSKRRSHNGRSESHPRSGRLVALPPVAIIAQHHKSKLNGVGTSFLGLRQRM